MENIAGGGHYLNSGGRDSVFSFYDITLVLVFIVAAALSIISYKAYSKKKNERLMFVAGAFFLFAIVFHPLMLLFKELELFKYFVNKIYF